MRWGAEAINKNNTLTLLISSWTEGSLKWMFHIPLPRHKCWAHTSHAWVGGAVGCRESSYRGVPAGLSLGLPPIEKNKRSVKLRLQSVYSAWVYPYRPPLLYAIYRSFAAQLRWQYRRTNVMGGLVCIVVDRLSVTIINKCDISSVVTRNHPDLQYIYTSTAWMYTTCRCTDKSHHIKLFMIIACEIALYNVGSTDSNINWWAI